ncbi:hypothetical protein SYNPS1DRAFT_24720 [Syncephalis pseudoplumigaleata]|uniref:Uncharacterized protein n=1 Tax=Syncephalis pseudoplumigaleata TaxID=1712513 RepID=A0A4P9YTL0_9FUNG|nr:hypothetical protein SYNPS1DRAFT_24720 [Syncephalis pseudoplumigaleata]|eukprot:RKP23266.1 hypothetical protein SYNPS1DRAFT_24720 [Syncephalis pseudoplumigaleata]
MLASRLRISSAMLASGRPLAARFSTLRPRAAGWLSATADVAPEYEVRHRYGGTQPASTMATKNAANDWLDVFDDAAEAQEAIRAFKEDGLVLGVSNIDGRINMMESNDVADAVHGSSSSSPSNNTADATQA